MTDSHYRRKRHIPASILSEEDELREKLDDLSASPDVQEALRIQGLLRQTQHGVDSCVACTRRVHEAQRPLHPKHAAFLRDLHNLYGTRAFKLSMAREVLTDGKVFERGHGLEMFRHIGLLEPAVMVTGCGPMNGCPGGAACTSDTKQGEHEVSDGVFRLTGLLRMWLVGGATVPAAVTMFDQRVIGVSTDRVAFATLIGYLELTDDED